MAQGVRTPWADLLVWAGSGDAEKHGERAVDVFYLTRADGRKLEPGDIDSLRSALLRAASEPMRAKAA